MSNRAHIEVILVSYRALIDLISDFSSKENKLLIHLDKIDQISGVLDKIEILDITFDEVNANVAFKV